MSVTRTMNLDELEIQYREAMDDVLNQMQTVVLLLAQAETRAVKIGDKLQGISQMMETYIAEERQQAFEKSASGSSERLVTMRSSERELREVLAQLKL